MDRIFHHDDTMYEAATKVYAKASDSYAYADSDYTVKIPADVLEDIYIRGMIIIDSGVLYKPVSCKIASGVATVTYVTTDSTSTTSAKLATIKSFDE